MFEVLSAIWSQDFIFLSEGDVKTYIIAALCIIIFLESAFVFLPLPGDSLIIFSMLLATNGVIDPYMQLILLPLLSALGTYCAFLQGQWLSNGSVNNWLTKAVSEQHLNKATQLVARFGLLSLFVSKFIPFVRVLVPMFMGMKKFAKKEVGMLCIASSFAWILSLSFISQFFYAYVNLGGLGSYFFKGFALLTIGLFLSTSALVLYRLIANRTTTSKLKRCNDEGDYIREK
ncbi:membrane protein [Psychromonas marina]|uniref:Membrane protein n=1 Tax=Psychromonas marina TaxID=88364 RepID=A0ABQ6DYV1_9GAMM|nr:VTT domain-containing protein [Psychromonas marina]GLS90120.1 membrane protein [Psychromonas marina]